MGDSSINTATMNNLVLLAQIGDPSVRQSARNELFEKILRRLERLAQRMLRRFPNVARHTGWEDLVGEVTAKLLRVLETRNPSSTREFFNLAAAIMRNHLIDLARKHKKQNDLQVPATIGEEGSRVDLLDSQPAPESADEDLDLWTAFHEAVSELEPELREVFSLVVYHDWPYEQIATLFDCSTKTIQRRYTAAVQALRERFGEEALRRLG